MQSQILLFLSVLAPGLVALAFSAIVAGAGYRDDWKKKPIVFFSLCIAFWNFVQLPLVMTSSLRYAQTFFIISQLATYLLVISFFVVSKSLSEGSVDYKDREYKTLALFTLLWVAFLFIFPSVASIDLDPTWKIPNYNYNTVYYSLYIIFLVAVMVYSFIRIARSKKLNRNLKRQINIETAALVLALIMISYVIPIFVVNNLFVEFSSVGTVLVVYLIFFSRTALQEKIIDLRANSWRTFIDIAVKGIVTAVLFLTVVIFFKLSYQKNQEVPVGVWLAALFVYTMLVGFGLWFSGRIVRRYLSKYQVDVLRLTQTVQRISYTKGVAIFSEGFLEILGGSLGSDRLMLVVQESSNNNIFSYIWNGSVSEPIEGNKKDQAVKHVLSILEKNKKTGTSFVQRHELLDSGLEQFATALMIKSRELAVGLIVGPRQDGSEYNPSDLSILSSVTNEFALTLENAIQFEEIKKFNLTLQEKIDDATRKLRRANEKLKQMDETKDEFISMASHQLRTPLTSMKGSVRMVLEGDAGKITALQRKLLDQAFISSQRMVYLIADLLNVSRLRTGKFIIENKPTNLADVVDTEVS